VLPTQALKLRFVVAFHLVFLQVRPAAEECPLSVEQTLRLVPAATYFSALVMAGRQVLVA